MKIENKNWLLFAGLIIILVGVALLIFQPTPPLSTPRDVGSNFEPYSTTLAGEYLCLPHTQTNGPQTLECALGMKAGDGKYYALDFNLSSTSLPTLKTGEKFSASGTVTPIERLNNDNWKKYPIVGIFSVIGPITRQSTEEPTSYVCTADVKMCPDGSYVGRTGRTCQFKACPTPNPTNPIQIQTGLNQKVVAFSNSVTPLEVTEDSRCPQTTQCVWAGTVKVRTKIENESEVTETILELGKKFSINNIEITLTKVMPNKTMEKIPDSSYFFTFEIKI